MWELISNILSSVLSSAASTAIQGAIGNAMAPGPSMPQGQPAPSALPQAQAISGSASRPTSLLGGGLTGAPPSPTTNTGFGSLPVGSQRQTGGFTLPQRPAGI